MKKKEIINLICPICEKRFADARWIPCNRSVCFGCIQSSIVNDVFKCKFCKKQEHEVPINGFPVSPIIAAEIAKEERILAKKKENETKKSQPKSAKSVTSIKIKSEPVEHIRSKSESPKQLALANTIKTDPHETQLKSLASKRQTTETNELTEKKPKKIKKDESDVESKKQNSKRKPKTKALEKYNKSMFMCAALNAYSKAKGYTELMFMQDFEKLLGDLDINIFDLYEKWCMGREATVIFNVNENNFELQVNI